VKRKKSVSEYIINIGDYAEHGNAEEENNPVEKGVERKGTEARTRKLSTEIRADC